MCLNSCKALSKSENIKIIGEVELAYRLSNNPVFIGITGTNGKSTTTHLLFTIFSDLGLNTYTNTDAESEGNTLIDPRVSDELTEFYNKNGEEIVPVGKTFADIYNIDIII